MVIHIVILIRWNCNDKWIPSQKLEASFLFQKIQNQKQSCCLMKCKMNQRVFLSTLRLQLSRFHLGKIILTSDSNYQVPKSIFPIVSELCKDTPGPHRTILWEKMSGESVLLVLTTIPVVTVIRWNCTVKWFPSQNSEACFLFQKQNNEKRCCYNEERNEPVFRACLGLQLPSFTGGK